MSNQPATQSHGREGTIIPARRDGVTALCAHAFLAVLVALGLRLLFVFRFPGSAGDSEMYIQFARTWADHHVYGFWLNGHSVPTDLRTPGYPVFLAGVAMLFGRSIRAILLSQAFLDVITCFLTAALAAALAPAGARRRVWIIALWLAATCPFVANYTAVALTEVLVTFLATAALCCFALGLRQEPPKLDLRGERQLASSFPFALLGGFLTGVATLVRPEMPLLLGVAVLVYALHGGRTLGVRKTIFLAAAMAGAFLLPLLPWAARNLITLRKVQFIAPRYTNLPGESAPIGYYAWTATWLERYRDVYLSVWKIGEEPVNVDDLPATAFDSPGEKARIADLFSAYNDSPDLDISPEVDRKFAEIARERTRRHPLRTYALVPFERALTIWFTPRTELMPIDGKFWPVREQWEDSHADVLVTGSFAVLSYLYIALAAGGVWLAWRARGGSSASGPPLGPNLWGIALLLVYFLVRTAFLTTVEAPEPRYVVSCYPGVLALIALLGARNRKHKKAI
jgi:4-amino-4-deoxy-L-arabinose transferase-like glycosyltransferase